MATTAINALRYPGLSEQPNVPTDMQELALDVDSRLNARFASTAARDTAIPSPIAGMRIWVTGIGFQVYNGNGWALEPGSFIGSTTITSADIGVNAGIHSVLISNTFTAVSGARYLAYFESTYHFNPGSLAAVHIRHASGSSITNTSTSVGVHGAATNSSHQDFNMVRPVVATASGTYTIGVTCNFYSGSGTIFWGANANNEMYLEIRAM